MKSILFSLLFSGISFAQGAGYSCPSSCKAPECTCASRNPPVSNPPQFLVVTFDDGVNANNMAAAQALFSKRRNPNGCPAGATWFAQAIYTDPYLLTQWYASGSEVADHSFTHGGQPPPSPSPFTGNYSEIVGTQQWFNSYAGIPFSKIRGVRFPFRNYTAKALQDIKNWGFLYDSSMAASVSETVWPYTLDYGAATDCNSQSSLCGQNVKIPGLWELPLYGSSGPGGSAHLMDPYNDPDLTTADPEKIGAMLLSTFNDHYRENRAPFGLYGHPVWLTTGTPGIPDGSKKLAAMNSFLDKAMANPDVWMVTSSQVIEYMRNPVPASQLGSQPYMQCYKPADNICNGGPTSTGVQSCNFPSGTMRTCYRCPSEMPTLQNPVPSASNNARCLVPQTCDTPFWDPVGCKCLCSGTTGNADYCANFKDTTPAPADGGSGSGSGSGSGGKTGSPNSSSNDLTVSFLSALFGLALLYFQI